MKVSTRGDYAARALLSLALHGSERPTSVKEIAEVMSLSTHTVGTHLYNIKQKLNASNSAELAIIAIRAGLIDP